MGDGGGVGGGWGAIHKGNILVTPGVLKFFPERVIPIFERYRILGRQLSVWKSCQPFPSDRKVEG